MFSNHLQSKRHGPEPTTRLHDTFFQPKEEDKQLDKKATSQKTFQAITGMSTSGSKHACLIITWRKRGKEME